MTTRTTVATLAITTTLLLSACGGAGGPANGAAPGGLVPQSVATAAVPTPTATPTTTPTSGPTVSKSIAYNSNNCIVYNSTPPAYLGYSESFFSTITNGYNVEISTPCISTLGARLVPTFNSTVTVNPILTGYGIAFPPSIKVIAYAAFNISNVPKFPGGFYGIDVFLPNQFNPVGTKYKLAILKNPSQYTPNFPYSGWQYNVLPNSSDVTGHIHFNLDAACFAFSGGDPGSWDCKMKTGGQPFIPASGSIQFAVYQAGD